MTPETLPDPIVVAADFIGVLERLGVDYVIAGSLASSVHGEPRSTNDVDIVADIDEARIPALVEALAGRYYVSAVAARAAVRAGSSFNAIHLQTSVKVDVYPVGQDLFDRERLRHRVRIRLPLEPPLEVWVDTPEHTILRKLEWFRRGGEASERQWRDVLAILRIQGERLDRDRLEDWAARLGVPDLLARAREESATG